MQRALKALDIYRRIPKDLTESSVVGGATSIVACVVLLLLFVLEIRQFMSTEIKTHIVIDHSEDGILQVNFNVTLPGLSCEFASIDLLNVIGQKREDIKDRSVHKFSLDGTWQGFASKDETVHTYSGTDKDHYGNQRHAIEIVGQTQLNDATNDYEAMIVDFHAPWCSHCRALSPVYEHSAEMVKEKAPTTIDSHRRHAVALATIDCTVPDNVPICRANGIQAYPTLRVYRQGSNKVKGGGIFQPVAHESYRGERTAERISDFALQVLKEVIAGDEEIKFGSGTDSTGDGKADSIKHTAGCRLDGFLMVQRVPGTIVIRPHSTGHDFNTSLITMDHKIGHLSFGNRHKTLAEEQRQLKHREGMSGAYSEDVGRPVVLAEGKEEVGFVSGKMSITHHHHIKVVSRTTRKLNGIRDHAYEYTINSNMYEAENGVPVVSISYDLSPLRVFDDEVGRPWIEAITSMCAILGGVYTCFTVFQGIMGTVVEGLSKKLE